MYFKELCHLMSSTGTLGGKKIRHVLEYSEHLTQDSTGHIDHAHAQITFSVLTMNGYKMASPDPSII